MLKHLTKKWPIKKTPTQPTIQPKNKEAVHKYNTTENMKSNHFLFSEMSDSNMTCVTHKYYYYEGDNFSSIKNGGF